MLLLTRKPDEYLIIEPTQGVNLALTMAKLIAAGPLVVEVLEVNAHQVRLGIEAPRALNIVRDELL